MNYRSYCIALLLVLAFYVSPALAGQPNSILVAAASSMKFAFDEMVPAFNRTHPGIKVYVSFGSSGNFYAQISNGAPFDIFFSADMDYPIQLQNTGRGLPGESTTHYATGKIVLWTPNRIQADVDDKKFKILLDPRIKKISIANPKHAPYGKAAVQALNHFGIFDAVQNKLIRGENVTQAAQFVHTGAAGAGIIALSLAKSKIMQSSGNYWEIPLAKYTPLNQGYLLLKNGKNPTIARDFADFVSSPEGIQILKRFGLDPGVKENP
jgi:molybdate transport system substrate-binding protein